MSDDRSERVWVEATCLRDYRDIKECEIVVGRISKGLLATLTNRSDYTYKIIESVPAWYAALELADAPLSFTDYAAHPEKWRKKP